jgi:hypothetical protein
MTVEEAMRWKTLVENIKGDMAHYEIQEQTADHDADAHAYGSAAWALQKILNVVHEILHEVVADEYQQAMEKDIASMEQGYGSE